MIADGLRKSTSSVKANSPTEFWRKARQLGHDLTRVESAEEDRIFFTVDDIDAFPALVRNATEEQARRRLGSFFQPMHRARQFLGQGVHDRSEAFAFAGGPMSDADRAGIATHLPLHFQSICVQEKVVGPGEQWDVSLRGDRWELDDRDELYTLVNVGRLILHPGASVVVQGNVFSFLCQEYVCLGGDAQYQFGILPTPFSVDAGVGPHNGPSGSGGLSGVAGGSARPVRATPDLLGYILREPMPTDDGAGRPGFDGEAGADGTDGRNGGMCYIAELTFRSVEGPLKVFSRAGDGGSGGDGGAGGNGGDGGRGRDGIPLFTGPLSPGRGGDGGAGGNGGRGGRGGNGGLASNIYIDVPSDAESNVSCISEPSSGGAGGLGGAKGIGGVGGDGGAAVGFANLTAAGEPGRPGEEGCPGRDGNHGKARPGPVIFLNDRL